MNGSSRWPSVLVALAMCFYGACAPHDDVSAGEPSGGAALGGSGGAALGGSGGGASQGGVSGYASFASVGEIVTYKCGGAGCHSGEMAPRLVNDAQLYATLTSFVAQRCGNRPLIKPGSPENSAFYLAQRGQCGTDLPLMPLGCVDNCTPPEYIDAVREWISLGAPAE